jgi:NAD(P)-dependent dehydrogenase (short-subunit alcohol dehydrogenase family)
MTGVQRVAIVTGGAGAIGLATAERLGAGGFAVQIVDRSDELLDAARRRLEAAGRTCLATEADVTEPTHVARMVEACLGAYGRIDALINVAGGAGPVRAYQIDEIEPATFDHVMDLNVRGTFLCCRAVVPVMRRQRSGRIVVLSSIIAYGEKGPPTTVAARLPYATAKAALLGFTAQLAKDTAADGITVNALVPGLILGEPGTRIADRFAALPEGPRAEMLRGYPVGRPGRAEEVAAAAAFLCSEEAGFISGAALPVDGAYL